MSNKEYPSAKLDQYIVRFPDGMRERLKRAAAANNRSLNAEIIARLQFTFDTGATKEEYFQHLEDSTERLMSRMIEKYDLKPRGGK